MSSRDAGNDPSVDALDRAAVVVSRLSRGGFTWVAAGAASAYARGAPTAAIETALSTWAADGAAVVLSYLVGRTRPCRDGRPSLLDCPDSPSLPSNHAAAATAAAVTLSRRHPRLRPVAVPAAAAVAAARVRAGVHHPSDVVAGAALGAAVSLATAAVLSRSTWWRALRAVVDA